MSLRVLVLVVLAAVAVSGCGRRGDLESPNATGAVAAEPVGMPKGGISPLDPGVPGIRPSEPLPPPEAPRRRFLLDFLL